MLVRQARRYSTKSKAKEVEKAFTERLQQLEADHEESESLNFKSLIDKDPKLTQLSKQLDQKKFDYVNQQAIEFSKIPTYAGKQSRDIALSQPWTGNESQATSSLRMLVDKHKPLKIKPDVAKLANAKETILDYTLEKNNLRDPDEEAKFKEIYQERFTPIGSFEKIRTIADSRIEESMRRGDFANINRNQKLNHEVGPHVDRTEHHLNNILKNQNIVPVWVEKQGGVNVDITNFRKELKRKWENHVSSNNYRGDTQLQKDFKNSSSLEYDALITRVNNSIRTYNLQAPLPTQKLYLIKDKEFQRCFGEVDVQDLKRREAEAKRVKHVEKTMPALNQGLSWKFWNW